MMKWLRALLTCLFPHHCYFCTEVILPRQRLCADCAEKAPYILPPVCERCGRNADRCSCGKHRHHFERCVSPFYHEGVAQNGISQLKNHNYRATADGFAAEMAEVVRREYGGIAFDAVTSVPLHKKDFGRRGFDQAAALGRALAAQMNVPYEAVLTKLTHTEPQKELSAVRRRGNLLGVFDVVGEVSGRTFLLVDDVITTGSTLDECAKMLKLYGAADVYAVTAAAAVLKKDEK